MNLQKWKWWAGLSPTKQLITGLAFILFVVGSAFLAGSRTTTASLRQDIKDKQKIIDQKDSNIETLNVGLNQCKEEKVKMQEEEKIYERLRAERAEVDKRRSDSLLLIVIMTKNTVEKAIKNERKK